MALFGRRKPGFSKEVELKPEEIPGEFSDALDPAVNKDLDNPKAEKLEYQHNAEHVINGEQASTAEKPDLLDYLESLPDVEDPFPPSKPEDEAPAEAVEKRPAQVLADFIRKRSAAAALTARKSLMEEAENMEAADRRHGAGRGLQGHSSRRWAEGRVLLFGREHGKQLRHDCGAD